MSLDLRFAFICQKKWRELPGNDPVARHCETCDLDVLNLDAMTDAAREKVFRNSIATGSKLCVSASVTASGGRPCSQPGIDVLGMDDESMPVAGNLIIPESL